MRFESKEEHLKYRDAVQEICPDGKFLEKFCRISARFPLTEPDRPVNIF